MEDTALFTPLLGIRPPWHVTRVEVTLAAERIDVWVEEAPGTKFPCGACAQPAPVYDHTEAQLWRHLDTCQCQTYVHARLPRTTCPADGVKQVPAPWAEPRSQFTRGFERRMIDTLRECDVTGGRRLLGTSWDATWGVLERAVTRGRARKAKRVPARIGIDEKAVGKGHTYESLVVDLDRGTVEAVVDDRTQASLERYYRQFTPEELAGIEAIALDMWDPYIAATKACVPDAERFALRVASPPLAAPIRKSNPIPFLCEPGAFLSRILTGNPPGPPQANGSSRQHLTFPEIWILRVSIWCRRDWTSSCRHLISALSRSIFSAIWQASQGRYCPSVRTNPRSCAACATRLIS